MGLIKSANDRTNQIRISPLVKQVKGVRDKIRNLQQPCLAHASEVGDIAEVSEDSPPCTPSPEVCDPHALTLLESPLGEHKQPTLTDFLSWNQDPVPGYGVLCGPSFGSAHSVPRSELL